MSDSIASQSQTEEQKTTRKRGRPKKTQEAPAQEKQLKHVHRRRGAPKTPLTDVVKAMPFDAIDIDTMAIDERDGVRTWIRTYRKDAENVIHSRYQQLYNTNPEIRDAIPEHLKEYFESETEETSEEFKRCPLIQCAAFFDAYSQVSCHELIFGTKYSNDLVGAAAHFVRTITSASQEVRNQVERILVEHPSQVDNPYFTIINRITEFGTMRGMTLRELYRAHWFPSNAVNQMIWMLDPDIPLKLAELNT